MSLLLYIFKLENVHVLGNDVLMNLDHNLELENFDNISAVDVFTLVMSELKS